MNYSELTADIQEANEFTFEANQLALFVEQAEKLIYNSVHVPSLRKSVTGTLTASTNEFTLPADFVWPESFEIQDAAGNAIYLLDKEYDFMREAYPNNSVEGTPKYYGLIDQSLARLGPVPDLAYDYTLFYGYYPESIVTAGTTWLGDNFGNVLFNASMVEAARFLKQEQDIVANYQQLLIDSLQSMKNVIDGRRRQDTYRRGEPRQPAA